MTIAIHNTHSQPHPAIATSNEHCKAKPTNILQCKLSYRLTSGLKDDPNPQTFPFSAPDVSRRWASSTLTDRKATRGQSAHPQPKPASVCPLGQAISHRGPCAGHDCDRRRHRWSCLGRRCRLSCLSADGGGPCVEAMLTVRRCSIKRSAL